MVISPLLIIPIILISFLFMQNTDLINQEISSFHVSQSQTSKLYLDYMKNKTETQSDLTYHIVRSSHLNETDFRNYITNYYPASISYNENTITAYLEYGFYKESDLAKINKTVKIHKTITTKSG